MVYLPVLYLFLFIVLFVLFCVFFFFSSRRRHTRCLSDWSSDVCSSDLGCRPPSARTDRGLRGDAEAGARPASPRRPRSVRAAGGLQPRADARAPRLVRRSEERRVGKEGRSQATTKHVKKEMKYTRV